MSSRRARGPKPGSIPGAPVSLGLEKGQGPWAGLVREAGFQAAAGFALIASVGTLALCVCSKTSGKHKSCPVLLAASCVLVSWATQGHGLIWDPALLLALELPGSPFAQTRQNPQQFPSQRPHFPPGKKDPHQIYSGSTPSCRGAERGSGN